ncbi:AP-2 complex subunit alpha, putative [Plasmodium knowlesi strain H]|uniref:AP-2 complex subunit alpha, putative n=3 Tax=Plasmodium knowlesi TaxID=5850 RepID=A0A5K1V6B6_PLAKH|nr:AP-2 complex subunit alpha, putative [Plasmodium knowlesi strain H]OTN64604.1 putative AP-2 complex subunit alpha [Plasmodium knowlesi]CAA9989154.1 AP-2 complex subunit alpha, putative [Plasmodium knowlesi strain H]SBO27373.1 AP-2 complex subunit alpha, putative [Plasmodium knowlesi strain H]SBO27515.1 AP-2 complex subunit alpha, putative [Plasmodium knowlesi strain H]VVS78628.1 AP-2 complex subunit alpha, putative [Plasmodium knowlesi strain H]|eukprot:XP_002261501.1 alpha adaptin-like protein, putative [Plasmodium knowlesi strain H]
MMKHSIKGLYCFIDEIRNCKCLEDEEKKVLQEIIKIKKKFNEKNISNYKRKKYIWKLIYCHILGYGISLSYLDIIKLMSSSNFSDKYCGYTALSLLVSENNEMLHMMISTIKLDLKSNDEKVNFLALHFASQKINDLLIENMYDDILHIVTSNYIYKPNIRKKAFLCLSNIYKKRHDLLLKNKTELEIFKFLDQNLNEVNMFNVFAYLNLIYVIILVFQKYEAMQQYREKQKSRKKKYTNKGDDANDHDDNDDEDDDDGSDYDEEDDSTGGGNRRDEHSIKREDLKVDSSNFSSFSNKRIISLNIKDEVKRMGYHKNNSSSLSNEQSFLYNDLKKVDKIMEIDSQCSLNMEEINFCEIRKYINKYIHFILNVLYLILDENLKIDEGFYYSEFRYPFLLIKCLQMVQLYDLYGLSQNTINNINDILYRIVSKPFKKLQGKIGFETSKTKSGRSFGHDLSNSHNISGNDGGHHRASGHIIDRKNIFRKSFSKNSFYMGMKKSKEELRNEKSTTYIEYAIIYECCNVYNFLGKKIEDRNRDIILCLITNSFDSKRSNINYVILNSLSKLKMNNKIYSMLENHIMHLINLLNNDDITIKLQTFNILFNMCNTSNWKLLINVFLHHLPYIDPYIQNEIIIKISILAENFSPDLSWYIDVIFKMIEITYRYIFPEVWFRLVQVVSGFVEGDKSGKVTDKAGDKADKGDNRDKKESISSDNSKVKEEQKVQTYAAMKCYKYLADRYTKIELLIDLCSYIIGSFGHLIKDKVPMSTQLKVLEMYFTLGSSNTKCVILMAIMKMVFYESKLMPAVKKILTSCITHTDLELQTRACEFLNLCNLNNPAVLNCLLKGMPLYHTKKVHENFLIKRLLEKNKHAVIDFNEKDNSLKFDKHEEKDKSSIRHDKNDKYGDSDDSRSKGSSSTSSDGSYDHKVRRKMSNGSAASSGNSQKSSSSLSTHRTKNSSEDHTDDNAKLFKSLCLQKANNINDLWFNACLLDKSLFFKNAVLSILIKQKYQENKAILTFYVKNISKTVVNLASIRIEDCEQMNIKETKIAMNEKIDSDAVYIHKIIITISDIFYNIPSIYFNVLTPNSANASLSSKLPILITRFIKENKMNEATFKIYWKALTQVHNEDIIMGVPKFSKKYFFNYLINAFNFYILKIGSLICASGYIHFPTSDSENKILILVKIRHEMKGCQISVVSSIKHLNNYLNKIFEIYLIKNK